MSGTDSSQVDLEQYQEIELSIIEVVKRFNLSDDNFVTVDQLAFLASVDDQPTREALESYMNKFQFKNTFPIQFIVDFIYFYLREEEPPLPQKQLLTINNLKTYQQVSEENEQNEIFKLRIQEAEAEKALASRRRQEFIAVQQELDLQKQKLLQELDEYDDFKPQTQNNNSNSNINSSIQLEVEELFQKMANDFCSRIQIQEKLIEERLELRQQPKKSKVQNIFQVQNKYFDPKEFQQNLRQLSTQLANLARNLHKQTLSEQKEISEIFNEIRQLDSQTKRHLDQATDETVNFIVIGQSVTIICSIIIIIGQFILVSYFGRIILDQ